MSNFYKKSFSLVVAFVSLSLLSGCASIINGTKEDLLVETTPEEGAKCTLKNSKGEWLVDKTPESISVHRAAGPLEVDCNKDGYDESKTSVKSTTKAAVFGNALLGGLIGTGVDCANGAAYGYPQKIVVAMKKPSLQTSKK